MLDPPTLVPDRGPTVASRVPQGLAVAASSSLKEALLLLLWLCALSGFLVVSAHHCCSSGRRDADKPIAASTALFFIAKKREWTVKETIRRSAKRVVTALTPRRTEFPKSVKNPVGRGGRMRLDDVPPTPRIKPSDLEKGLDKANDKRNLSRK